MKLLLTILILLNSAITQSLSVNFRLADQFDGLKFNEGRIILFITQNKDREPRFQSWPTNNATLFAKNFKANDDWEFNGRMKLTQSGNFKLNSVPKGKYYIQALLDIDKKEKDIFAPGNLYSTVDSIEVKTNMTIEIVFNQQCVADELKETDFVKYIDFKSDILSKWWKREMKVKVGVVLPSSFYEFPNQTYPFRYNIGGYGSRYTRAGRMLNDSTMNAWWMSGDAPQIVNIFLDGESPLGDSYQLNSENNGPYGDQLIKELIPFLENKFRGIGTPESRFLDGCSTGGWVSLALKVFYPDFFNATFSYSADPVDFHYTQLFDAYEHENAFYSNLGYELPSSRDTNGYPRFSIRKEVEVENVLGWSDSFVTSGEQWGGWNSVFSPKGKDGLPMPIFDPVSGKIDKTVAEHWRKNWDIKAILEKNWKTLGPKLQGKLYIWMGDMDNYYLNNAMRSLQSFMEKTKSPKSDAIFEFVPMERHCGGYNQRRVLNQIKAMMDK